MLNRRRMLESLSSSRLPAGFQETEYIESTGTQYIDINFNLDSAFIYEIDAQYTDSSWGGHLCSLYSGPAYGIVYDKDAGQFKCPKITTSNGNYTWTSITNADLNRHTFICDMVNKQYKVDSASISQNYFLTSSKALILFAYNSVGPEGFGKLKFYNGHFLKTNATRNLVSCYCTENKTGYKGSTSISVPAGTAGVFDMDNGIFYVNSGSGEDFIKGPDV